MSHDELKHIMSLVHSLDAEHRGQVGEKRGRGRA
jgi:hypothetical protein